MATNWFGTDLLVDSTGDGIIQSGSDDDSSDSGEEEMVEDSTEEKMKNYLLFEERDLDDAEDIYFNSDDES